MNQVYQGKQPFCGSIKSSRGRQLPVIQFDKQSKRDHEFLKVDDDPIQERFTSINHFSKFSTKYGGPKGIPKLGKGALRTCKFDELAKPRYNCHHYNHDFKIDLTVKNSDTHNLPFELKYGFLRSKSPSYQVSEQKLLPGNVKDFAYKRYDTRFRDYYSRMQDQKSKLREELPHYEDPKQFFKPKQRVDKGEDTLTQIAHFYLMNDI